MQGTTKTELRSTTVPLLPAAPHHFARLRRLGRLRRQFAPVVLVLGTCVVLAMDFSRRSARLASLDRVHDVYYLGSLLEGALVWGVLLHAAARGRGALRWVARVLFVIGFTFAVGGQTYFYSQYNAYLNLDVSLFASNFKDSVLNQLLADYGNYLRAKLPPLCVALALIWSSRRVLRPRYPWSGWTAGSHSPCGVRCRRSSSARPPDAARLKSWNGSR